MAEIVGGGKMRRGFNPDGSLKRRDQALPRGTVNLDQQVNGLKREKARTIVASLKGAWDMVFHRTPASIEVDGVTPYIEDMRERHDARMGRNPNPGMDLSQAVDPSTPDDLADVVGNSAEPGTPQIFVHTTGDRRRSVVEEAKKRRDLNEPRTRKHGAVAERADSDSVKNSTELLGSEAIEEEPEREPTEQIEITPELATAQQPHLKVVRNDKSS